MKRDLILPGIAVLLVLVCGCSQPAAPVQPAPAPTTTVPTSAIPVVTSTTPLQQPTASVSDNTVRINNFEFTPATITVKTGSTVRWVNEDTVPHRIRFEDEHITASFILAPSDSWSQKFDEPGIYRYICLIHPEMHGTVIVVG